MQPARPLFAPHPRAFGRGQMRDLSAPQSQARAPTFSEEFKLFATTFVAGFLFVSILLA